MKERIEKEKGVDAYPVASQKLIYAGKIMADEETINKYNIDEKKFVVVMVTKGKPATPAASSATPASESVEKKETKEESKAEPVSESKVIHLHDSCIVFLLICYYAKCKATIY